MIKVQIKKNNIVTNQAKFNTQEEAETWYMQNKIAGVFGKQGGWYNENQLTEEQKLSAIEVAENNYNGEIVKLYKLDDEFTTEFFDITQEIEQQNKITKATKKKQYGQDVLIFINSINEDKINSGSWSSQTIENLLSDPTMTKIQRLLDFGSLEMPFSLLQATDVSAYYNTTEKNSILDLLQQKITLIGG